MLVVYSTSELLFNMKILYINLQIRPALKAGGPITHMMGVIDAFFEMGHEVVLVTYPNKIVEEIDYCHHHFLPNPNVNIPFVGESIRDIVGIKPILNILNQDRFDLIYARWNQTILHPFIRHRHPSLPIVLECNSPNEIHRKGIAKYVAHYLDQLNLRYSTLVSAVTPRVKDFLIEHHDGMGAEKIIVNPNGVDTTLFRKTSGENIRQQYHIPMESIVIGWSGSMVWWHGVEDVIDAFYQMNRENLYLLLIGDNNRDVRYKDLLKSKANDHPRIIFTGQVPFQEIPHYLSACNILVCPLLESPKNKQVVPKLYHHRHGSPLKLFEYMAMEIPVVVSDTLQNTEYITHEKNGLIHEIGSAVDLKKMLLRLIDDPELARRLGENGRKTVEDEYTWRMNVERIFEGLNNLESKNVIIS